MLKFTRPAENTDFDTAVSDARDAVRNAIDNDEKPVFPDEWGEFKGDFSAAQDGRCGYCELPVIGGQHGDVEHYAPKSVVTKLLAAGEEKPNLSNISGRKFDGITDRGYWWLAYDWNNYLLSCLVCNQKWKVALFPIEEENDRVLPPEQEADETPLLLNPFGRKNPTKHFVFGDLGEVTPRNESKFGRATIDVCGLDRPSLRLQRLATIQDVKQLLVELIDAIDAGDDAGELRALKSIHRMGMSRNGARFPGVVRSVFENEIDMSWSDLEAAVL